MEKLRRFLLFCAFAAMIGFVLEGVVRLSLPVLRAQLPTYYYRAYMEDLTQPDRALLWSGFSNADTIIENSEGHIVRYQLSQQGWRDKEFQPKDGDILVLGDSFTFGTGVQQEETYVHLLHSETGRKAWNLGVMGYAPDQYYILAKRLIGQVKWGALIVQLSNNDLSDMTQHFWMDASGIPVMGQDMPELIYPTHNMVIFNSYSEILNVFSYLWSMVSRSSPSDRDMEVALHRLLRCVAMIVQSSWRQDVPVLFLQANDWGENVYGKFWGSKYRETVRGFTRENGIHLVEPHKQFELKDFLPFPDLHWRASSHETVAKELAEELKAMAL